MTQHLSNLRADVRHFDPDTDQVRIHFEANEEGFATLVVFNPQGGWVLSLGEIRIRGGANTIVWHGHDSEGWPLADGEYSLELFGFALDRRPTSDAPLRLQIALARRYREPSNYIDSASRKQPLFPNLFLNLGGNGQMEQV